jgi:hypothetical protein
MELGQIGNTITVLEQATEYLPNNAEIDEMKRNIEGIVLEEKSFSDTRKNEVIIPG